MGFASISKLSLSGKKGGLKESNQEIHDLLGTNYFEHHVVIK